MREKQRIRHQVRNPLSRAVSYVKKSKARLGVSTEAATSLRHGNRKDFSESEAYTYLGESFLAGAPAKTCKGPGAGCVPCLRGSEEASAVTTA